MQVTLTPRRLALAGALVLAGALAPLGYSALGKSSPAAARPLAIPAGPASVATPQALADVADSPYQVYMTLSTSSCQNFPLPAVQDFVLQAVTYEGEASAVRVGFFVRTSGAIISLSGYFEMPISQAGGGGIPFNLVVRPGSGNIGDVVAIELCATQVTTPGYAWVTGQRIAGPTAVHDVVSFGARQGRSGATLRWTTGAESNLLGFNVWRYRNGKAVKVNRALIRAKRSGQAAGASYGFVDAHTGARRGLSYRLQLVDVQGKRTWYAAFAIPA
jgi:hypothetical protein